MSPMRVRVKLKEPRDSKTHLLRNILKIIIGTLITFISKVCMYIYSPLNSGGFGVSGNLPSPDPKP